MAVAVPKGASEDEIAAKIEAKINPEGLSTLPPQDEIVPDLPSAGDGPAERMQAVERLPKDYQIEFKMRLLHRLLMRGLSMDVIAGHLRCSVDTARHLRRELYKRLKAEAARRDMNVFFGQTEAFYNEVRGMAMRIADETPTKIYKDAKGADGKVEKVWSGEIGATRGDRIAALRAALSAEADRQRFYLHAGIFERLPVGLNGSKSDGTDHAEQAGQIIDMVEAVLDNDDDAIERFFVQAMRPEEDDDGTQLL